MPGIAIGALIFAGCSMTETRISGHPEIYQSLSSRDQALVSQGQIRDGMSPNAVYLAWGSPDRKIVGNICAVAPRRLGFTCITRLIILWQSLLRSILLFLHTAKYP